MTSDGPQKAEVQLSSDQMSAISRALADPKRFAMLRQIAAEPVLACSGLNIHSCLRPATISHHLKELQAAGLINVEREGRSLHMSLRRDVWQAYLRQLAAL